MLNTDEGFVPLLVRRVREDPARDFARYEGAPLSFGDMAFQETTAGLVNTYWASNPPPPDFPILCPQIGGCNNSLASTMYYFIWGSRSPVLAAVVEFRNEPHVGGESPEDVLAFYDSLGFELCLLRRNGELDPSTPAEVMGNARVQEAYLGT